MLASGVVLQTVIYKGLYGIDRFFLKEIKNVMFLNKIDVPYCLVVFFVVCPRLEDVLKRFHGTLALVTRDTFHNITKSRAIVTPSLSHRADANLYCLLCLPSLIFIP